MPWGATNELPYDILNLIESDEVLQTCQSFNAEVSYAQGIVYQNQGKYSNEIEDLFQNSDMPAYFLGAVQDFNHFAFSVSVIILNRKRDRIVRIERKEAIYCRFAPKNDKGVIPYLVYANFRNSTAPKDFEVYPLLNPNCLLHDLQEKVKSNKNDYAFAVVSRMPTVDSTYYPIPHYAALFKGHWYDIKQLIGIAKKAKLQNSAPIKYLIEVSRQYWQNIFTAEGITDINKKQERLAKEKKNIIDFLTGAENSGKVWFSNFYVDPTGKEQHDVKITKVDSAKEGGDWESDIQEAINMYCFTMRVHSNLVGSVPGKAQSNNSGSDKRELYTIAQALKKPYRDILFNVHRLIIAFNGWKGVKPLCPFIQLTTLDEHVDAKTVTTKEIEYGK
ncbi:MAG: hypothetical protein K2M31_07845 [Muribaculaceae bacterium]|nr:hypothetical protein [Muribaculaceae bacterium]